MDLSTFILLADTLKEPSISREHWARLIDGLVDDVRNSLRNMPLRYTLQDLLENTPDVNLDFDLSPESGQRKCHWFTLQPSVTLLTPYQVLPDDGHSPLWHALDKENNTIWGLTDRSGVRWRKVRFMKSELDDDRTFRVKGAASNDIATSVEMLTSLPDCTDGDATVIDFFSVFLNSVLRPWEERRKKRAEEATEVVILTSGFLRHLEKELQEKSED